MFFQAPLVLPKVEGVDISITREAVGKVGFRMCEAWKPPMRQGSVSNSAGGIKKSVVDTGATHELSDGVASPFPGCNQIAWNAQDVGIDVQIWWTNRQENLSIFQRLVCA